MAIPTSIEARLFYRCAWQRHDDAQALLRVEHTTGAVYLAGYGVACMLKALLLAQLPPAARGGMVLSFRGAKAHDFEWLRDQYFRNGGARFPREISVAFALVNPWSTDLRYLPGTLDHEEADRFLTAAERVLRWADGRL